LSARTFTVSNPSQVEHLCAFLVAQVGAHPLTVAVEKWRKQRSLNANSRYWKLTSMAAEHAGYTREELHEQNLGDYFGWKEGELFGKPIRVPARTTTTPDVLDTKAFADFMAWAEQRYIDHLGVWLEN
jgi:hypothetical protein